VVSDTGQKLVIGAVADLVHADELKPVQPAPVEPVGHDPLQDVADRLPGDPHQPRYLRLAHLLRQPRREILEIAGVARPAARPLHRLGQIAAVRAIQPSQLALDHAPHAAEIEMAPALDAMILDRQAAGSTTRTEPLLAAQRERHDHRPL